MAAISYPLTLPTNKKVGPVTFRARSVVAESRSPFTGATQVVKHQGQWWEFEASLPPMLRADAEVWISFFLSLNGKQGTFLFGDPNGETARGAATGTPHVYGAGQTGDLLVTGAWTGGVTGIMKEGDYFSLGSGTSTRLHKVINADVNSDAGGFATLRIWPDLRSSPLNNAALDVTAPKGHFRLTANEMPFQIQAPNLYSIAFAGMEAIT
jgi:hypothetical protein